MRRDVDACSVHVTGSRASMHDCSERGLQAVCLHNEPAMHHAHVYKRQCSLAAMPAPRCSQQQIRPTPRHNTTHLAPPKQQHVTAEPVQREECDVQGHEDVCHAPGWIPELALGLSAPARRRCIIMVGQTQPMQCMYKPPQLKVNEVMQATPYPTVEPGSPFWRWPWSIAWCWHRGRRCRQDASCPASEQGSCQSLAPPKSQRGSQLETPQASG